MFCFFKYTDIQRVLTLESPMNSETIDGIVTNISSYGMLWLLLLCIVNPKMEYLRLSLNNLLLKLTD
ncbi:hypothetical protein Q3G72_023636 [Acer saccharum]|nr:hypothetical protein Q3G72_009941 [Acer saccharum]KAK1557380.1 hypothetical protein Q3G72_023636 [Acer saccharum]